MNKKPIRYTESAIIITLYDSRCKDSNYSLNERIFYIQFGCLANFHLVIWQTNVWLFGFGKFYFYANVPCISEPPSLALYPSTNVKDTNKFSNHQIFCVFFTQECKKVPIIFFN